MNATERVILKAKRQVLREENAKWPVAMTSVPEAKWPDGVRNLSIPAVAVWRSREHLAVLYVEPWKAARRLSICRAAVGEDGRFLDGLSWDDLQRLKSECGFGDVEAVEIYPADRDVVNVSNMRHLWLLPEPCEWTWRRE